MGFRRPTVELCIIYCSLFGEALGPVPLIFTGDPNYSNGARKTFRTPCKASFPRRMAFLGPGSWGWMSRMGIDSCVLFFSCSWWRVSSGHALPSSAWRVAFKIISCPTLSFSNASSNSSPAWKKDPVFRGHWFSLWPIARRCIHPDH